MQKQSLINCLSKYSDSELIKLHKQLNLLVILCEEDLNLLVIVLRVHFAIKLRDTPETNRYMKQLEELHEIPEEWKYAKR